MTTIDKIQLKYIVILVLFIAIAGVFLAYVLNGQHWRFAPSDAGKTENLGSDGIYLSEAHGFGIMFPGSWSDVNVQDKDGGVKFSLKDKSGKYISIFEVHPYSDNDYAKLMSQPNTPQMPYFIAYKDGVNFVCYILIDDAKRSEFDGVFSSVDYKGFSYDIENNIFPTFKFVDKGNISDLKGNFQKENEFKLIDTKPGDKINGMTVVSIAPFDEAATQDQGKLYVGNASVKFSGEITLTGNYKNEEMNPAMGDGGLVCIVDLDDASQKKIPNFLWTDETTKFCFSNQDFAKQSFSPAGSSGQATVVVDDYTVNKYPANVNDVARLVRVAEKK